MKRKTFICAGCGTRVIIANHIPTRRGFIWEDVATKKKSVYCFSCDDLLLLDLPLPIRSGARESGARESGARESGARESGARESGARESGRK